MGTRSSSPKKSGVGSYMENLLEHLNYLLASAQPDFLIYLDEAIIYKCVQRKLQQCKIVALHQSDCSVKLLLPFLSQLSDKIKVNTSVSFFYAYH